MRSHENTPLRVDRLDDEPAAKDTMTIIDKTTLRAGRHGETETGKTAGPHRVHQGRRTRWPACGRRTVRSSSTTRPPSRNQAPAHEQAVGKYNVWNKITRSEGTSH